MRAPDRQAEQVPETAEIPAAVPVLAPSAEAILRLQRSAGNQAVARMLQREAAEPELDDEEALDDESEEDELPLGPEDRLEGPVVAGEGETAPGGAREPAAEGAPPGPGGTLARRVTQRDTAGTFVELTRAQRERFARTRFRGRRRRLAYHVLADMAEASNELRYDNEDELYVEVLKRVTSSLVMQGSQDGERRTSRTTGEDSTVHAFGYPFTGSSLFYGARVNHAARDYWTPNPPDAYAVRRDRARNRQLRALPRGRRHEVYGDVDDYSFDLTARGQADFFSAVTKLFIPQPPHRRSLIHCDYLISLVQMRSFAATLGQAEFNRRAIAHGASRLRLTWDLFASLEFDPGSGGAPGPLASLQAFVPASEADFVIGDHVYFFNHQAYDLINSGIGNNWRLENTILVDRRGRTDLFLGHGSGRRTAAQLRAKLADEYNEVADLALRLARRVDRGDAAAIADMAARFPNVNKVGAEWRVQGTTDDGVAVDLELRRIHGSEVVGPHDPADPSRMYPVDRPLESA